MSHGVELTMFVEPRAAHCQRKPLIKKHIWVGVGGGGHLLCLTTSQASPHFIQCRGSRMHSPKLTDDITVATSIFCTVCGLINLLVFHPWNAKWRSSGSLCTEEYWLSIWEQWGGRTPFARWWNQHGEPSAETSWKVSGKRRIETPWTTWQSINNEHKKNFKKSLMCTLMPNVRWPAFSETVVPGWERLYLRYNNRKVQHTFTHALWHMDC